MDDLIKALQIFSKYTDSKYPTHCEHDILTICDLDKEVNKEDSKKLDKLGFHYDQDEYQGWYSFRFGSC